MSNFDLLTIVIPAFNEERRIHQLLADIARHHKTCPVVVADNNSTDQTRSIVESLQGNGPGQLKNLKLISVQRQGVAFARNAGAAIVKTPYIFFVDADSRLYHTSLQDIAQEMKSRDLHIAGSYLHSDTGRIIDRVIIETFNVLMWFLQVLDPACFGAGMVVDRKIHHAVNGFKNMDMFEDVDYIKRIVRLGFRYRMLRCKASRITFCMRRFERKGYLAQMWQYVRYEAVYLVRGSPPDKIDYVMGGKNEVSL